MYRDSGQIQSMPVPKWKVGLAQVPLEGCTNERGRQLSGWGLLAGRSCLLHGLQGPCTGYHADVLKFPKERERVFCTFVNLLCVEYREEPFGPLFRAEGILMLSHWGGHIWTRLQAQKGLSEAGGCLGRFFWVCEPLGILNYEATHC